MKTNIKLTELHTLFGIKHGSKLDLNKMTHCRPSADAVSFVGRSGEHNGIVASVERLSNVEPYAVGLITVALGGSALSSFVQPLPFYTAQNVDVLTPLAEMHLDVKLYYCMCIEANRFRYSTFGREANRTLSHLLIPDIACVPEWVHGISLAATEEFAADLGRITLT